MLKFSEALQDKLALIAQQEGTMSITDLESMKSWISQYVIKIDPYNPDELELLARLYVNTFGQDALIQKLQDYIKKLKNV